MDFNRAGYSQTQARGAEYDAGLRAYMLKIYNYMAFALVITGAAAMLTASSETLMQAIYTTPLKWVVMFAPLVFLLVAGSRMNQMSENSARLCLMAFAAVMGVSLSYIFVVFTGVSIVRTFFVTAAAFASLSLYGYTTKKDLSGWGSFLIMGVFGIIIAAVVNIFLQSSALSFATSVIAILIFAGLTAYDTQKLKNLYYHIGGNTSAVGRAAVLGALTLYIDFIVMFQHLLQFMGDRR